MSIIDTLRNSADTLLNLLYPPHCVICAADLETREYLCQPCRDSVRLIRPPFCQICSQPFDGMVEGEFSCANCAQRDFHFECAVACHLSQGVIREVLHRFKYQREFYLRHELAAWLMRGLEDSRIVSRKFDMVVPVPLHPARERTRQFNQARALAEMVARRTGAPLLDCLKRIRKTPTQTHFDRSKRMENLLNAFKMRKNMIVHGKHLLLIDDVFTTGSTVDECARILKNSGADSVRVLTVARG